MADPEPSNSGDVKLSTQPITEALVKKIQTALETRAKILGRVRSYESNNTPVRFGRNSNFVQSPYSLEEIGRALDVEPYILQSIKKHRTSILKEGYEIYGTNEEGVQYIKQRLLEIALVTGIPTEQWIREFISNVITYHNGFLILRRDATRSSGSKIRLFNKELQPIAGIFVGDPISMGAEIDKYGTPVKWRQRVAGNDGNTGEVELDINDVIHVPVDRKTGFLFGTPYLIPVLSDISSWRKLEELVLIIATKEAHPLYHYKVGTEDQPAMMYDDGMNEVDMALSQIMNLPSNGFVVTSARHSIELLSREKAAMDIKPLLEYFEARVLGGLSLSPIDLGRGGTANKGTGSLIGKNLEDSAKDYQSIISAHLTQQLIIPLLLEGGFDVTLENMVYFQFPMIDREELRAHQNHGLQLYLSNGISLAELRKKYLNLEEGMDEADTVMNKQLQADITLAKATPKPATSSSGKSTRSVAKTVANKSKPTNQYGSTPKSRFKKKNDYLEEVRSSLNSLKEAILSSNSSDTELTTQLLSFCNKASSAGVEYLTESIESGFNLAEDQFIDSSEVDTNIEPIGSRTLNRFFSNFVNKSFWKVVGPYKASILNNLKKDDEGNTSSFMIIKTFEVIAKDIESLISEQEETAKRFGFAKFAKRAGYNKIDIIDNNEEIVEQINISEIIYKDLLPTQTTAGCYLRLPIDNNDKEI